ncbi:MAG: hypothetical protein ACREVD_03680 [Burkholderiales bacterium]
MLRQRYLLLHSTRTDAAGDALAEQLAAILQRVLPQANALVARATDERQLASLLTSGQALVAVMRPRDAEDLFLGRAAFAGLEGGGLRRLLDVDARVLMALDAFPSHHGWLLSAALTENAGTLAVRVPRPADSAVPVHAGALAFARGEPLQADR